MTARTRKPATPAPQLGAPALISTPAIVLTPEEATLLRLFRSVQDAEQKRIIRTIVKVTAEVFPRHAAPGLRLVVGGAS